MLTPVAVPPPVATSFLTVTLKTAVPPGCTVPSGSASSAASGILVMMSAGGLIFTNAVAIVTLVVVVDRSALSVSGSRM